MQKYNYNCMHTLAIIYLKTKCEPQISIFFSLYYAKTQNTGIEFLFLLRYIIDKSSLLMEADGMRL